MDGSQCFVVATPGCHCNGNSIIVLYYIYIRIHIIYIYCFFFAALYTSGWKNMSLSDLVAQRNQLIKEWMDVGAEPRQLLDLLTERVPWMWYVDMEKMWHRQVTSVQSKSWLVASYRYTTAYYINRGLYYPLNMGIVLYNIYIYLNIWDFWT